MLNCANEIVNKWEDNKPFVKLSTEEIEVLCVSLVKATHAMYKILDSDNINNVKKEATKFLEEWPFGKEKNES